MRADDLMDRLEDKPFKPFRIHMSDGTTFDVRQAGMVVVSRSSAVLPSSFTQDDAGRMIAEHFRTISLLHIVQFSDLDESVNGRKRRRK